MDVDAPVYILGSFGFSRRELRENNQTRNS